MKHNENERGIPTILSKFLHNLLSKFLELKNILFKIQTSDLQIFNDETVLNLKKLF